MGNTNNIQTQTKVIEPKLSIIHYNEYKNPISTINNHNNHSNNSDDDDKIQLFVVGDCIKGISLIECTNFITIKQLKQKLCTKFDLKLETLRVSINNGKPLNKHHCTLLDYGITDMTTVHITTAFSSHKITVVLNDGKFHFMNFKNNVTIDDIKQQIQALYGFPIESQTLYRQIQSPYGSLRGPIIESGEELFLSLADSVSYFDNMIKQNILKVARDRIVMDGFWKEMRSHLRPSSADKILLVRFYRIVHNLKKNKNVFEAIKRTKQNKSEYWLYHGTSTENIEKIICNGFDRNHNKRDLYGKGTYFALSPLVAMKYCTAARNDSGSGNGSYAMLACRVLVGDYTKGFKYMGQEALYKEDGVTQYDSLVNDVLKPSIFVINRDYHAIPMYVIEFKRNLCNQC